jgi:hypothetical protein
MLTLELVNVLCHRASCRAAFPGYPFQRKRRLKSHNGENDGKKDNIDCLFQCEQLTSENISSHSLVVNHTDTASPVGLLVPTTHSASIYARPVTKTQAGNDYKESPPERKSEPEQGGNGVIII